MKELWLISQKTQETDVKASMTEEGEREDAKKKPQHLWHPLTVGVPRKNDLPFSTNFVQYFSQNLRFIFFNFMYCAVQCRVKKRHENLHYLNWDSEALGNSTKTCVPQDSDLVSRSSAQNFHLLTLLVFSQTLLFRGFFKEKATYTLAAALIRVHMCCSYDSLLPHSYILCQKTSKMFLLHNCKSKNTVNS